MIRLPPDTQEHPGMALKKISETCHIRDVLHQRRECELISAQGNRFDRGSPMKR
jgi:hypothetical protein